MNRREAEIELGLQLESGASIDQIVDGAKRYGEYCKARHLEDRYIKFPKNFLSGQHWRDEFPLPTPKKETVNSYTSKKGSARQHRLEDPDRKLRQHEARIQEAAWQSEVEGVWKARVANIRPVVDEVSRLLDLQDSSLINFRNIKEDLKKVRAAARFYFRKVEGNANEARVTAIGTAWLCIALGVKQGNHPPLVTMRPFEGEKPLMVEIARYHMSHVTS